MKILGSRGPFRPLILLQPKALIIINPRNSGKEILSVRGWGKAISVLHFFIVTDLIACLLLSPFTIWRWSWPQNRIISLRWPTHRRKHFEDRFPLESWLNRCRSPKSPCPTCLKMNNSEIGAPRLDPWNIEYNRWAGLAKAPFHPPSFLITEFEFRGQMPPLSIRGINANSVLVAPTEALKPE